jgi:O-antigen biosynthesis protein
MAGFPAVGKARFSIWSANNPMLQSLRKFFRLYPANDSTAVRDRLLRWIAGRYRHSRYRRWVRRYDTFNGQVRRSATREIASFSRRPLISVLMPVYDPREKELRSALASVTNQVYDNWELCIADDCSTEPYVRAILEELARVDPRVKVVFRPENGHISEASNSALELAAGEFTALLDHDDELSPLALFCVAAEVNRHPSSEIIYTDEDKIDRWGHRADPFFKPDWSPEMLLAVNYVNHLTVYRTALIRSHGGFRVGFEGSQDYDLLLRVSEKCEPGNIRHIPRILYHWRAADGSIAGDNDEKPYAHDAAKEAIAEHLAQRAIAGRVSRGDNSTVSTMNRRNRSQNSASLLAATAIRPGCRVFWGRRPER